MMMMAGKNKTLFFTHHPQKIQVLLPPDVLVHDVEFPSWQSNRYESDIPFIRFIIMQK